MEKQYIADNPCKPRRVNNDHGAAVRKTSVREAVGRRRVYISICQFGHRGFGVPTFSDMHKFVCLCFATQMYVYIHVVYTPGQGF